MAHLYYREDLSPQDFQLGSVIGLIGDEGRHAVRVSRLRVGEEISIGDGAGSVADGQVIRVDRDSCDIRVTQVRHARADAAVQLVLVQALAKGDRDERAVEQATEFGVDRIVPWQAQRSVSRWDDTKAARGVTKWQRVAREAAKQSLRARIPVVEDPVALAQLTAWASQPATHMLVLHPRGERKLSQWCRELQSPQGECVVVIGPEGGMSDAELTALASAGAEVLQLGDTVLRTSSAGPAALVLLNQALQRW